MIKYLVLPILAMLSYIIPKKKNYWVFLPGHDQNKFSGNLKYFFKYINSNHSNIHSVWLTKSDSVYNHIRERSLPVKTYFIFPFWQLLRAEYIFIDGFHRSFNHGHLNFIQLWHGTGFKNIIALSKRNENPSDIRDIKQISSLYRLVTANTEDDKDRKMKAFLTHNVYITGSPRDDIFFDVNFNKNEYKQKVGLSNYEKSILYAPTYRQNGKLDPFTKSFWVRINDWASSTNNIFLIKKHPKDREFVVPDNLSHIRDVTESIQDVQELLSVTDILISDYSSIVTDYVLTGRPIIFYINDYEDYLKTSRTFYYDLKSVLPGPFAYNESELQNLIVDTCWFEDHSYQERYKKFLDSFHKYKDGQSSARLFQKIMEIDK